MGDMPENSVDRPDRTGRRLHGVMETFELDEVISWLSDEAEYSKRGRNSLTLVKNAVLRTVVICLQKGAMLHEHRAPGPITIQVLRGKVQFVLEPDKLKEPIELGKGELLVLEESRLHEVTALQESALLLTLVNLKGSGGEKGAGE